MKEERTILPGKSSIEQELERVRQRGRWITALEGSAVLVLLVASAIFFLLSVGMHRTARAELATASARAKEIIAQAEAGQATARTAEDTLKEAEAEAQRLVQEAERQAEKIVESARSYADSMIQEAEGGSEEDQTGVEVSVP